MAAPARSPHLLRWLLGLLVLLVLLAAVHTGVWLFATSRLESTFAGWQERMRAAGYTVRAGASARGGWPLAAALDVPEVTLATPAGLSWRASDVRLLLTPQKPTDLLVDVRGAQEFRADALAPLDVTAGSFTLAAPLSPGFPTAPFTLRARSLRLAVDGAAAVVGDLTVSLRADPEATRAQAALSFAAEARDIALPGAPAGKVLGPRIGTATLRVTLSGPVAAGGPAETGARAWRDGGGALSLAGAGLVWGPVTADATGSFRLDAGLQPEGRAEVRVKGIDALLQSAVAAGSMTAREARAGRAVLTLLAPPEPGNASGSELAVPVTLKDRMLAAGSFTLLQLPRISWPSAAASDKVAP